MPNPGLLDDFWSRLEGRLWHATEREGVSGMISDGAIRPKVGDFYKSSFCRRHGAICLFDFGPTATNIKSQYGNWHGWLGHQQEVRVPGTRVAVWLDIDRTKVRARLLDAEEARQQWHATPGSECKHFIPGVEACHHGPIPLTSVAGVLLVAGDGQRWRSHRMSKLLLQQIDAFEAELSPPEPDGLVERLQAGRLRTPKS